MDKILQHLANIQNILAQQRAELVSAKNIIGEMNTLTDNLKTVEVIKNENKTIEK